MGEVRAKIGIVLALGLALGPSSRAGAILLGREAFREQQDPSSFGAGVPSSSYLRFHGPVEGPAFEVKVPYEADHEDRSNRVQGHGFEDHGEAVDFVARPKYEFSYGVADHETGDFHGQQETRDGSNVSGQYNVMEPGGGVRVVSYRADEDGFHAVVRTSGKTEHTLGSYDGRRRVRQQDPGDHDYDATYVADEG